MLSTVRLTAWIGAALLSLPAAQITRPPEFQSGGEFQKGAAAPLDGTAHVAVEQARINRELVDRLRALPGNEEGVRLIESRLLTAAAEHFEKRRQLIGLAVTRYLSGGVEQGQRDLLALPRTIELLPFLGEMAGATPELTPAMVQAMRDIAIANPRSAEAQYYLARGLSKLGAPPAELERHLRKAAELDRKDARALLLLGRLLTDQERETDAIAALEDAVRRDPTAAAAHYRLARLYRARGDEAKSRVHLEAYQKLQPRP